MDRISFAAGTDSATMTQDRTSGCSTWWPSSPRQRPPRRTESSRRRPSGGATRPTLATLPPMLPLLLGRREEARPLRVLALGAHSDDIEIGCAGTILRLLATNAVASVCWVVLSGKDARAEEARESAEALLADAPDKQILAARLPGRVLPLRRSGDQGVLRGSQVLRPGPDPHPPAQRPPPGPPPHLPAVAEHVPQPPDPRVRGAQVRRRHGRARTCSSRSTTRSAGARSSTC